MKKFLLFLLFFAAFTVGTTGCIFEDITEDEPTAALACAVVAFCLFCYVFKCLFSAVYDKDEEERIIDALTKQGNMP